MNDETPEPLATVGDEPVEARIVAWVLGESSAFEAAELERLCEERPELLVFRRRMRALHGLLTEAEASEADHSWKLPPDKRKALDEIFGQEKPIRLEPERESSIRSSGRRAVLAIAACVVFGVVMVKLFPRSYESQAVIEVRPRSGGVGHDFGDRATPQESAMNPQFYGTEFEKIKNTKSLSKVVNDLNLTTRWSVDKETAVQRLKKNVIAEKLKGTDLIAIRVREKDEQESREIVREVVETYRAYRNELEAKESAKALAMLNKAVRDQEDKVEERRKVLNQIAQTKGKIYGAQDSAYAQADPDGKENATKEDDIRSGADAQDYVDAKRDFETDQELLQEMKLAQINETIKSKIPDESIIIHDMPDAVTSRSSVLANRLPVEKSVDFMPSTVAGGMGLARGKAGIKEELNDKTRERMAKAGQPEVPAVELKSELPALADSAPMNDLPQVPGQAAAGGLGGARGSGHGMSDQLLDEESSPPSEVARNEVRRQSRSVRTRSAGRKIDAVGSPSPAAASAPPAMPTLAARGLGRETDAESGAMPASKPEQLIEGMEAPSGSAAEAPASLNKADRFTANQPQEMTKNLNFGSELATDAGVALLPSKAADADEVTSVNQPEGSADSHFAGKLSQPEATSKQGLGDLAQREMIRRSDVASAGVSALDKDRDSLDESVRSHSASTENADPQTDDVRRNLYAAEGSFNLGKYDESKKSYEEVLRKDPYNLAARRGMEKVAQANTDYYRAAYDTTRAELLSQVDAAWELSVPEVKDLKAADEAKGKKDSEPLLEKQKAKPVIKPPIMEEISADKDPYSTFSLNISDASFQLAKAALAKGERPDPGSIKPEQFYNAVDYGDPAPSAAEPVAATIEQSAHPVIPGRNLVRVALRTASVGRAATQALRLTLLIDQSGSMVREDRRAAMEHALTQLGGLLTANDVVTVVGFSRTPHLLADRLSGGQGNKLGDIINQAASEGGTNLEEAMKLGGQMAERQQLAGAQNRIVLFTDGAANLGDADPDRLSKQVTALRQKGIAFDIAGIGADGLNDRLLGDLARHGNGRYYVVGDGKDDSFARQIAGAFRPAVENVKVQVIFNPLRVGNYKLLGFEKDRLKTEDFRNDSVDAAELAADEAGVALYQIETLPEGTGEIGEVSVRFRDTSSGEMVERSWTIPHEDSAPAFDRATPSMQLAGLSLLAAEKLRGGPLADAIDFKELAVPLAEVRRFYQTSPRVTEMLQVIDAIK